MRSEYLYGSIRGVVTAIPSNEVISDDENFSTAALKGVEMTGVKSRRWSLNRNPRLLMCKAALELLKDLNWRAEDISYLVVVTQTPDRIMPSMAYDIHSHLKLPENCVVIEVNWSCAGYVYGLWLAMKLIAKTGIDQRVLLLVGDTTNALVDTLDSATAALFGDAASATAIETAMSPTTLPNKFILGSDGAGANKLTCNNMGTINMSGTAVFSFTLKQVPRLVNRILSGESPPDYLLFHQANAFMLDHLVKKMKLDDMFCVPAQIPTNIDKFGNCSSASIPLLISSDLGHLDSGRIANIAMFGYGAGWSWAGAYLQKVQLSVIKLIEVDE